MSRGKMLVAFINSHIGKEESLKIMRNFNQIILYTEITL